MAQPNALPFPDDFSLAQLEALRVLTCYSLGLRQFGKLFPAKATDELPRPSDQDIRRFKNRNTRLDFDTDQLKIRTIYTRIFAFLSEDMSLHRDLRHLIERVFHSAPSHSRMDEAAQFFYSYFQVNPQTTPEFVRALQGVYYLYRFGELSSAGDAEAEVNAEYVRSVLGMCGRKTGDLQWIEFRLSYKAGKKGEGGVHHIIKGPVVPMGKYLYLLGADEGMTKAPCLMIGTLPSTTFPIEKINAHLLRLNTLNVISAARTVSLRIKDADNKLNPDQLFAKYEGNANIYSQGDPVFEREFKSLLKEIDNRVDGKTKRTLRN